jgi:FMN phosphatase YigB (HAD superfamily)
LGALKPNKKAFWQILKRFGVKPEETLFISDACDELKGAKKIGIVTTGFRCCCGDHNVERLDEICQILEELNEARVCRK